MTGRSPAGDPTSSDPESLGEVWKRLWRPLLVWVVIWAVVAVVGGILYGQVIVLLCIAFLLLTSVCIFLLPPLMMRRRSTGEQLDAKDRLTLEMENRKALIQAVAGAALIATFAFGWQQLKATSDQTRATLDQVDIARSSAQDQQLSEQFTRAINELSNKESLLGGIATLEQTATQKTSDGYHDYYDPALRYLTAVARSVSSEPRPFYRGDPKALPSLLVQRPEVQAAMEAIDRLRELNIKGKIKLPPEAPRPRLELAKADLIKAGLPGAYLADLGLEDATLIGADLNGADLSRATLTGADLRGANLDGADLNGADLNGAIADKQTHFPEGYDQSQNGIIRIQITSPVGGDQVDRKITVEGTYETGGSNPPFKDAVIWVAVYIDQPGVKRFYPQYSVNLEEGKPWKIKNVGIGAERQVDKDKSFDVVAIIADPDIDRELSRSQSSGLPELPVGAIEMDRVTVVRR